MTVATRSVALTLLFAVAATGCGEPGTTREEAPQFAGSYVKSYASPEDAKPPSFTDCPDGWKRGNTTAHCEPTWEVEPPRLTDCPSGWATTEWYERYGLAPCLPTLPGDCGALARTALDAASCKTVGATCPAGSYPPTTGAAIYVRAGSTGGSGTLTSPYGTLTDAISAAAANATIAVGDGTYNEAIAIDKPLTIIGTCASRVVIEAPPNPQAEDPDEPASIQGAVHVVHGGELQLENVTVTGQRTGLRVIDGNLTARGVIVDEVLRTGVHLDGGEALLEDVLIRSPLEKNGERGRGIQTDGGAKLTARGIEVRDPSDVGILATGDADQLTLEDVRISGTSRGTGGTSDGVGLKAWGGRAVVSGSRVVIQGSEFSAVYVLDGSSISLDWALLENSAVLGVGVSGGSFGCAHCVLRENYGYHVLANGGSDSKVTLSDSALLQVTASADAEAPAVDIYAGQARLDRVRVASATGIGVRVVGATAQLTDVHLSDIYASDDGAAALVVSEGAEVETHRLKITDSYGGLVVSGSRVTMDQFLGQGISSTSDEVPSSGALITNGSDVIAKNLSFNDAERYGLLVFGRGTQLVVDGLVVTGVSTKRVGQSVIGVTIGNGARFVGSRVLVEQVQGGGINFLDDEGRTRVELSDFIVRNVEPLSSGDYGFGIGGTFFEGALRRGRITSCTMVGLQIEAGSAILEDLAIGQVQTDSDGMYGFGVMVRGKARVEGRRLRVEDVYQAGIVASDPGTRLSLSDVRIVGVTPSSWGQGVGVLAESGSELYLKNAGIEGVVVAGLLAQHAATLGVLQVDVRSVGKGTIRQETLFNDQQIDDVSDGVLATTRATANLSQLSIEGASRAGLVLDSSWGNISEVSVSNSEFGLALQGTPRPEVEPATIHLEALTPYADDCGLPVPQGPPPSLESVGMEGLGTLLRKE